MPKSRNEGAVAALEDPTTTIADALQEVTRSIQATNERITQLALALSPSGSAPQLPWGATAQQISIWEDDPFSEVTPTTSPSPGATIAVGVPAASNPRLRFTIAEAQPTPARYNSGTPEFRYWLATEALVRGINFWSALLPAATKWSTTNPMMVRLVAGGEDLNAFYKRLDGLHFFRKSVSGRDIFSGESPDVVLHELGHAILDALKPQLFHAASTEAGAFHEAFGDMSAILCALQLPSIRTKVIAETGGRLNVSSRLSRLAEQLGWGIRQTRSDLVDQDSLRNAANRFFYRRPDQLPPSAPANLLSTESHSFSRVFTGAFLDALAAMFKAGSTPNEANLLALSQDIGQLLIDAILTAPVTPAYFSQVAAAMVQAEQARFGGRYRNALTRAFVERGILSVSSAIALSDAPVPNLSPQPRTMAAGIAPDLTFDTALHYGDEPQDNAFTLGYDETPDLPRAAVAIGGIALEVHTAEEPARFEVVPAKVGIAGDERRPPDDDPRTFVEALIQRGEVDLSPARAPAGQIAATMLLEPAAMRPSKLTHVLAQEDGAFVLKRTHFNCGLCGYETPPSS